jgi:methyl acetate hydrolase
MSRCDAGNEQNADRIPTVKSTLLPRVRLQRRTKMRLIARPAAFLIALSLAALAACSTAPPARVDRAAAGRDLDGYLAAQVGPQRIPGMVAMVVDAKQTLYLNAFGQQDVAGDKPMRTDSIFRIASMTKPVTAVAAVMLIEEGKLGLDDPASKYLPEFANRPVMENFNFTDKSYTTRAPKSPVTVRQLFTHTSGLGYPFASRELAALSAGAIAAPENYPLLHDPGTRFTYGESTKALGRIVEVVSGQKLEPFLRARLFDPLGMKDTSYTTTADRVARVVTVHRKNGGRLVETPNAPNAEGAIAAPANGDGGLNSTAADYAKFIQLFLNKGVAPDGRRLLSEKSVALIGQNHTGRVVVQQQPAALPALSEPFPLGAGRDHFGLAVQVTGAPGDPGMRLPGSISWAGIFNTEFWIDPKAGIGGILLMQYLPFYDAAAISTLQGFEQRAYAGLR